MLLFFFNADNIKQTYRELGRKSAHCFSQVNSILQEIYLSTDLQRDLISYHFQWPLIASMSPQEQYRRLFLSRMPHASPILERTLELKKGGYLHENGIFKINSLGTIVAIESEESSFICHLNTGKVIKTDKIDEQQLITHPITRLKIDREGKWIYKQSPEKTDEIDEQQPITHPITRLKIDCEGKWIYKQSPEKKGILSYYNSTTGKCERQLNLIDNEYPYLLAVRVHPETMTIFSIHSSRAPENTGEPLDRNHRYFGEISRLWNLDTGAIIHTFDHSEEPLSWFKMLPDGTQFLSGSIRPAQKIDSEESDGPDFWKIKLWNFNTKEFLYTGALVEVTSDDYKVIMSLSGDGSKALFCRDADTWDYCNLLNGDLIHEIGNWNKLWEKPLDYLEETPLLNHDGTRAFHEVLDEEKNEWVAIWDPTTGTPLGQVPLKDNTVDLAIEPDERKLVCLTTFDSSRECESRKGIQIFDLSASFPSVFLPESSPPRMSYGHLKVNPLSLRYVTLNNDLKVWNSAPLVHERIADVAARWLCSSEYRETVFDRLPSSVREFVDCFPEENTTDETSKRYQGLMRYLEEKCVPEIVELLDKSVTASENQQEEEAAIYREQALRWIENTALKEKFKLLVLKACTSGSQKLTHPFKIMQLILDPATHISQKRKLPESASEEGSNKRQHLDDVTSSK